MKTGTIVIGICSSPDGMDDVIDRCVDHLVKKGRKNVRYAFFHGTPGPYDVMKDMFINDGVDTFCILPITVAEGDLTVWRMPKALTLPDNSGSWTWIGNNDVATRFATALGFEEEIAECILEDLGEPEAGKGALTISYGSNLSQSEKTANDYASYLKDKGWTVECGFTRFGRSVKDAADSLIGNGCKRIEVVPLMITSNGKSFVRSISELKELDCDMKIHAPLSGFDVFYEILDRKVPEGW